MTEFAGYRIEDLAKGMEAFACAAHAGRTPVVDGEAQAVVQSRGGKA